MSNRENAGSGPIVVALGGNAVASTPGDGAESTVERTAAGVARVAGDGHDVVLTHGNGPQVGRLLLRQTGAGTDALPLDVLVAQTQAELGYPLQRALEPRLAGSRAAQTLVTQTVVDADDPAFGRPTKPVGPFYTEEEAAAKPFETREVGAGERAHRRVVPSPEPRAVVERDTIARLLSRGVVPICAGGGGIPVVRENGLRGVEAVVDKDSTSRLLATELGATTLVVLTDVEAACVDFGTPNQRPLGETGVAELREHLAAGEFGEGSMRPKVTACVDFVENGGERAVITTPDNLHEALAGDAGTRVRP